MRKTVKSRGPRQKKNRFTEAFDRLCNDYFKFLPPFDHSDGMRSKLRKFVLMLTDDYVTQTAVKKAPMRADHFSAASPKGRRPETDIVCLDIPQGIEDEVEVLKELVWQYVIDGPPLHQQQGGAKAIIKVLFEHFVGEAVKNRRHVFPIRWRQRFDQLDPDNTPNRIRLVVDYISGMTEAHAVDIFLRLSGARLSLPQLEMRI